MRVVVAVLVLLCGCQGKKSSGGSGTGTGTGTGTGIVASIDRTAETKAFFAGWNAPDAVATLHAAAHPTFQQSVKVDELQIFHDDFTKVMGPFKEVTTATTTRRKAPDGSFEDMIFGELAFAKGPAPYELVLVDSGGALRLHNLKLEAPKQLKPPLDPAAARAVAKAAADAILAGDYAAFDAMSLPRIRGNRTPDDTVKLRALLAELGGGVRLEVVKDEACGEIQHCVVYHAVGAKGGATVDLKVSAPLGTWRVNHWNLEMDKGTP